MESNTIIDQENQDKKLFFSAFSNPLRMKIVELLRRKKMSVSEIAESLGVEQSRVSHNLKCLVNCGFVKIERNGKFRMYEIDKEHIEPILKHIDEHIKLYREHLKKCELIS